MKTIRIFKSMMTVVLMSVMVATLAACGGDDEDDLVKDSNVGIHRIDVQFSDNAANYSVESFFFAMREDKAYVNVFENGKELKRQDGYSFHTYEVRDFSVTSESGCGAMVYGVLLTSQAGVEKDVTVTVVGYVNGKRIKTQILTLPAGKTTLSASFNTETTELFEPVIR